MFTGLVETTGTIRNVARGGGSARITVAPARADFEVKPGDSVAINGVCLTLEEGAVGALTFRAVEETLIRSALSGIHAGDVVNLERAVRPVDRMGGHFVLGHVDGVGRIRDDERRGESLLRTIEVPADLIPFLAEKGSVTVDGVSLTIAGVGENAITLSLIPYSLDHTTMSRLRVGDRVNIECDVLARYMIHFLRTTGSQGLPRSPASTGDALPAGESLYDKLQRLSF
jgi:riboflavin synthase